MTDEPAVDPEKVRAIQEYFEGEFPDCSVTNQFDLDRVAQTFRIDCRGSTHVATIKRSFMEVNSPSLIIDLLKKFLLVEHLREIVGDRVIVTEKGLEMEVG
jgi:hypothetical protein